MLWINTMATYALCVYSHMQACICPQASCCACPFKELGCIVQIFGVGVWLHCCCMCSWVIIQFITAFHVHSWWSEKCSRLHSRHLCIFPFHLGRNFDVPGAVVVVWVVLTTEQLILHHIQVQVICPHTCSCKDKHHGIYCNTSGQCSFLAMGWEVFNHLAIWPADNVCIWTTDPIDCMAPWGFISFSMSAPRSVYPLTAAGVGCNKPIKWHLFTSVQLYWWPHTPSHGLTTSVLPLMAADKSDPITYNKKGCSY